MYTVFEVEVLKYYFKNIHRQDRKKKRNITRIKKIRRTSVISYFNFNKVSAA